MLNNKSVISNLIWKFAERISAQLVTLIVSIILARLLEPSDYGVISIVTIFITLANVFVSDGFGSALIQKKDADALDFSSVLFFNIFFSCVLYMVLFFAAPLIAKFYGEEYSILVPVLRVLGIRIIVSGINSVQHAYVSRNMMFSKFFWSTLFGTVISAVVGIIMAYKGYGVWALVAQYLTNTIIGTIVLWFTVKIEYIFKFSLKRLKRLLNFGVKILASKLLITGFQELRALIIGKMYTPSDLAFFDKGKQFPSLIVTNIDTSISSVLFPKISSVQDNKERVKEITRNSIRFSAFVMCPIMLGFLAISKPFILFVLTEKWLPCVPLLQWFCIVYLLQPIHSANLQAIKAIGRSDIIFKLELIKKSVELIVLIITVFISVKAVVIGMALCSTLFTFVNAFPNIKLLGYSFKEQLLDLMPPVIMAVVMLLVVYVIGFCHVPALYLMMMQIVAGILIYLALAYITKNKELVFLLSKINKKK